MQQLHELYLLFKVAEYALKYPQTRGLHNWAISQVVLLQNEVLHPDNRRPTPTHDEE